MSDAERREEPKDWTPELAELETRRAIVRAMGGEARVKRQHDDGRLVIRERIQLLVDEGSFREIGDITGGPVDLGEGEEFMPHNFLCGLAKIEGRLVAVGGEDSTIAGGTPLSELLKRKQDYIEALARAYRIPLVWLEHGAGGSVRTYARSGATHVPHGGPWAGLIDLSSQVPLVSAVLGPCAGFHAGLAALSHFTVMVQETAQVFASGPPIVKRTMGTIIDKDSLGGTKIHARLSGVVDNEASSEAEAMALVRQFLGYLPSNAWQLPPRTATTDDPLRRDERLISIVPRNRRRAYSMRTILRSLVDVDSEPLDFQPLYGRSLITMFGRVMGESVGFIANDCMHSAGAVDGPAADKMLHFVSLCSNFNIPLVFLVDTPGAMVGPDAEQSGVLHRAMRAIYAVQQAKIPFISIVVRKCYGIGGGSMGSGPGLIRRVAWPSGEWASIPIEGGVGVAYHREISAAADPGQTTLDLEAEFMAIRSPLRGAEAFGIENVIDPRDTRKVIVEFLEDCVNARTANLGPTTWHGVWP
jgi:acetyl-CoA carboxylase carboxyltransferase component